MGRREKIAEEKMAEEGIKKPSKFRGFFLKVWEFVKKHKWSVGLVTIALLVAAFFIWDSLTARTFTPDDIFLKPKKETKVRAPLSGRMVEEDIAKRTPMAIVVENHPDARPQSGLNKAAIVYETFAEGGITRFLAIFQDEDAGEIGPVRSARTYSVLWAKSYGALYGHVGGSKAALSLIKTISSFYDLDQFGLDSFYWRDNNRYAPHNVYTTTKKIMEAAKERNYPVTSDNIPAYQFKDDAEKEDLPKTFSFTVNFNTSFAVTYTYSPEKNEFYRSIAGVKHTDRVTKEQVKAKNVIVMFSDFPYGNLSLEKAPKIRTTGTGKAFFYIDGVKTAGTWKRNENTVTRFFNAKGKEVTLNAGTTWIDVVPVGTAVK